MTPDCAFCRIARGEAGARIVLADARNLAFLDHRPLFPGHVLLIPREHFQTLGDLPGDLLPLLFTNAQLLARAVEEALGAEGSFVAVNNRVSQSVPHLHIHIVPRWSGDTNFMTVVGETRVIPEDPAKACARLRSLFGR